MTIEMMGMDDSFTILSDNWIESLVWYSNLMWVIYYDQINFIFFYLFGFFGYLNLANNIVDQIILILIWTFIILQN